MLLTETEALKNSLRCDKCMHSELFHDNCCGYCNMTDCGCFGGMDATRQRIDVDSSTCKDKRIVS